MYFAASSTKLSLFSINLFVKVLEILTKGLNHLLTEEPLLSRASTSGILIHKAKVSFEIIYLFFKVQIAPNFLGSGTYHLPQVVQM